LVRSGERGEKGYLGGGQETKQEFLRKGESLKSDKSEARRERNVKPLFDSKKGERRGLER